jgi:hypothetical protein
MSDHRPSSSADEPVPSFLRVGHLPPPASSSSSSPPPPGAVRGMNGFAIASLVASVALFGFGSFLGIVLGHVARRQIARTGGRQDGEGLATAGIILGWIGLAVGLACVIGFIVLATVAAESGMAA